MLAYNRQHPLCSGYIICCLPGPPQHAPMPGANRGANSPLKSTLKSAGAHTQTHTHTQCGYSLEAVYTPLYHQSSAKETTE